MYDLLGWIKSQLISKFYVPATDELPDVREMLEISDKIGAISAAAYLGDVGDSVTGDKRAQKFEDDFLDELIEYYASIGFRAVTYMPSRNTKAQLTRVRGLCGKFNLFQISGEDINSPRQSFVCVGAARSGVRQPLRGDLGADCTRMAFDRESRRRSFQQKILRAVEKSLRTREGFF